MMKSILIRGGMVIAMTVLVAPQVRAQGHGPNIIIRLDDEQIVKAQIRDNEPVTAENLGVFLPRVEFRNTKKMPIKGDDAKPDLATIKGKFELRLYERRGSSTSFVTSVAFTEIRLARSNPIAKHGF